MSISYLKNFERWDFYSLIEKKLKMVDASDTPFLTYDNGTPCYEANMYMHKQLKSQMSRRINGGTLKTYAKHINHLVKYCYNNNLRFSQLTDEQFTVFVHSLQEGRDQLGKLLRSNNHVIQIANRCLDFLIFVKECHNLKHFIGEGRENAISITFTNQAYFSGKSKVNKTMSGLTHKSIPTKDAVRRRLPVSEDSALKVWGYIQKQKNRDKAIRDTVIYQCLEQLGARISEISLLRVKDVEKAIVSGENPFLVLRTLKRRDSREKRNIPVTNCLLSSLGQYIRKVRKKIISKTIGKENDHGYLLVSLTTGKPFHSSTMTSYMNMWKKAVGVKGEFHPHLFRHAFITNKLKELILQHKEITSADKFREHLLHTERFKLQLQQWTGHTNIKSLDIYINLVFADTNGYSEVYNAVQLNSSVKVVKQQVAQIRTQLQVKSTTPAEVFQALDEMLVAFERDVESSLKA